MPQKGAEFILKVQLESLSFVNHLKREERKWMIGFTGLEVQIFILKITEQNETFIIANKNYSNVPGTINKTKLISVTKKSDLK